VLREIRRAWSERPEVKHPLTALHIMAGRALRLATGGLLEAERLLEDIKAEERRVRSRLERLYGRGYLTVKRVRNKVGKPYSYLVWRTPRKDIYLKGGEGQQLYRLRSLRKRIRERLEALRKARNYAYAYYMSTRHYAPSSLSRRLNVE